MSQNISWNLPINSVSFGQTSVAILRELYKRGLSPNIFPIGNVDLATQKPDEDFNKWLQACISKSYSLHSRDDTVIKLWHIVNSLETYSRKDSRLITFYECQDLTPIEQNILRNQDKIYLTNRYTQSTLKNYDIQSEYLPLGFDSYNFYTLEKRPEIEENRGADCGPRRGTRSPAGSVHPARESRIVIRRRDKTGQSGSGQVDCSATLLTP